MLWLLGGPISACWAGPFRRGCAQGASEVVRGPSRTRTDLVGELGGTAWGFSRLRRYCFYARSTRTRVHARGVVCTARVSRSRTARSASGLRGFAARLSNAYFALAKHPGFGAGHIYESESLLCSAGFACRGAAARALCARRSWVVSAGRRSVWGCRSAQPGMALRYALTKGTCQTRGGP